MATENPTQTPNGADEQVQAIIDAGAAGVETAMQALEAGEQAYYGAVAATETQPIVTITAVTPYSYDSPAQ